MYNILLYVVCCMCIVCYMPYTVYCTLYNEQCTMQDAHCTSYSVLYKVQRTLSIVQYIHILHLIYVVDCMSYIFALNVCRVFTDVRRCKTYTVRLIGCTVRCTSYGIRRTVYVVHTCRIVYGIRVQCKVYQPLHCTHPSGYYTHIAQQWLIVGI